MIILFFAGVYVRFHTLVVEYAVVIRFFPIARMGIQKLTDKLAEQIEKTAEGDMLDLIVELDPARGQEILAQSADLPRRERIEKLKEDFADQTADVVSKIAEAGGEILDQAWLNKTLKVRLPAGSISSIAEEKEVSAVDLPETIEPQTE